MFFSILKHNRIHSILINTPPQLCLQKRIYVWGFSSYINIIVCGRKPKTFFKIHQVVVFEA